MQGSLLRSRAPVAAGAAAPLARGNAASTSGAAARRSAPVARAAMVEELEAMSTDAAFDKDDAYRRFEALLGEADIAFATGDKVMGTVFRVDQKGAYVDVGGKTAAFCPAQELSLAKIVRSSQVVGPGQFREFMVVRAETAPRRPGGEGTELMLSLRRLEQAVAWRRLAQCLEEDATVTATVVGCNRGGILADVEHVRGFCPGSQLGFRVAAFEELVGKTLDFKVVEVDEEKGRLMMSNKRVAQADAAAAFKVGDVVAGTVISVKPYGAFIDLGSGVSGLLHISQISHDRILNVDKVLAEGDAVKVMVLSQDRERGRVALCTKKLEPTPGDMLRDPAAVYARAEEMAALFRERVAAAEAAARAEGGEAAAAAAPAEA